METASLVCEGPCNPHLATLDAAIRVERKRVEDCVPVSDQLAARLRTLAHTPHTHRFAMVYACDRCGTSRTWG